MKRDSQLRRTHRLAAEVEQSLAAMRSGKSLHLQHRNGKGLWSLSGAQPVTAGAASVLINHASVEPADTALFFGLPGQCWRMK